MYINFFTTFQYFYLSLTDILGFFNDYFSTHLICRNPFCLDYIFVGYFARFCPLVPVISRKYEGRGGFSKLRNVTNGKHMANRVFQRASLQIRRNNVHFLKGRKELKKGKIKSKERCIAVKVNFKMQIRLLGMVHRYGKR